MTRAPSRIRLEVVQASDSGRDPNKQVNEDSSGYAECSLGHLLVLCDGMGGHHGGREASRTAISTIFEVIDRVPPHYTPAQALKAAVEEAGRRVYALGGPPENRMRPGSTVVAALLHDGGVEVSHVGDSRAYVIRSNQIYPLTRDHSMVQGMIDAGMLTEEQAIGHPDLNKITRALGMKPDVDVEIRPEPMEIFPGDMFLTTSDGLTDVTLNADIIGCVRQALASGGLEHAANMLVKLANDRGGPDNITVQLAKVLDVVPKNTIPDQRGPDHLGAGHAGAGVGGAPAGSLTAGPTAVGMPPPSSRPLTLAGAAAHPLIPSPAGSAYGPVSARGSTVSGPAAHTPSPGHAAPHAHGPASMRQPHGQQGQHGQHAQQGQQGQQGQHGQHGQHGHPQAQAQGPASMRQPQAQAHPAQPAHAQQAHAQQAYAQQAGVQAHAPHAHAPQAGAHAHAHAPQAAPPQAHVQAQQAHAAPPQAQAQAYAAPQAQAHAQAAAPMYAAAAQRPAGMPVAPTVADAPASQRVAPTVPGPTLAENQAKGMGAYRVEAQLPLPPRSQRFDAAVAPALMAPAWSPPAADQRARNNLIALVFGGATALAVVILLVLWLVYK